MANETIFSTPLTPSSNGSWTSGIALQPKLQVNKITRLSATQMKLNVTIGVKSYWDGNSTDWIIFINVPGTPSITKDNSTYGFKMKEQSKSFKSSSRYNSSTGYCEVTLDTTIACAENISTYDFTATYTTYFDGSKKGSTTRTVSNIPAPEIPPYTLTLDYNGGTVGTQTYSTVTKSHGKSLNISFPQPVKTGYTAQNKWVSSVDNTAYSSTNNTYIANRNDTLVLQWTQNPTTKYVTLNIEVGIYKANSSISGLVSTNTFIIIDKKEGENDYFSWSGFSENKKFEIGKPMSITITPKDGYDFAEFYSTDTLIGENISYKSFGISGNNQKSKILISSNKVTGTVDATRTLKLKLCKNFGRYYEEPGNFIDDNFDSKIKAVSEYTAVPNTTEKRTYSIEYRVDTSTNITNFQPQENLHNTLKFDTSVSREILLSGGISYRNRNNNYYTYKFTHSLDLTKSKIEISNNYFNPGTASGGQTIQLSRGDFMYSSYTVETTESSQGNNKVYVLSNNNLKFFNFSNSQKISITKSLIYYMNALKDKIKIDGKDYDIDYINDNGDYVKEKYITATNNLTGYYSFYPNSPFATIYLKQQAGNTGRYGPVYLPRNCYQIYSIDTSKTYHIFLTPEQHLKFDTGTQNWTMLQDSKSNAL